MIQAKGCAVLAVYFRSGAIPGHETCLLQTNYSLVTCISYAACTLDILKCKIIASYIVTEPVLYTVVV